MAQALRDAKVRNPQSETIDYWAVPMQNKPVERPGFRPIGTPVEELDTPALVLDLAAAEHNIRTVHSFFEGRVAKIRPHIKTHNCPAIGWLQMASDGTAGGICTAKVGQAEVFAQNGFNDILIANEIVTRNKIDRLCALARRCSVTVAVDSPDNVKDLSQASTANSVTLGILVDVNSRQNRCGVEPGQPALDLARIVASSPGLHFAGLMSYEGCILHAEYQDLVDETRSVIQLVLDTREMIEKAGFPVETVSVGGTHNYEIAGDMAGVTEVQAGSYVLMDNSYLPYRPQLKLALRVLGTVISRQEAEVAVADVGQKAIGADQSLPTLEGIPGAGVKRLSAEHSIIALENEAQDKLDLGSKVWMTPYDAEVCINLYNYVNVVRNGKLEAIWEVSARGRYD